MTCALAERVLAASECQSHISIHSPFILAVDSARGSGRRLILYIDREAAARSSCAWMAPRRRWQRLAPEQIAPGRRGDQ